MALLPPVPTPLSHRCLCGWLRCGRLTSFCWPFFSQLIPNNPAYAKYDGEQATADGFALAKDIATIVLVWGALTCVVNRLLCLSRAEIQLNRPPRAARVAIRI